VNVPIGYKNVDRFGKPLFQDVKDAIGDYSSKNSERTMFIES